MRLWTLRLCSILCLGAVPVQAETPGPNRTLMEDALAALDRMVGSEIAKEDRDWLRERWSARATANPRAVTDWLESIALAETFAAEGFDPLAYPQMRHRIIDRLYCDSLQTRDPDTHRSRAIVATEELVLAEDCITGAVVTPFDLAALADSNARVGDLLGRPVGAAAVEAELKAMLPDGFGEINPEGQQRLLWGELRAAALEAVLASADDAARKGLIDAGQAVLDETGDVASAALAMEKQALGQLNEAVAIAREGAFRFSPHELASLLEYAEFATGATLSPAERIEVAAMLVRDFHEDPKKITDGAANARHWLDKGRHFGTDPETGKIRSWTAEEKVQARRGEAVHLYCSNRSSDDSDGERLAEILFAHDPVIESDCDAKTFTRESERVVAEDDDYEFTRGALDAHRGAFERLFAVRFTPEERRWFDAAAIADVRRGRPELTQAIDGFQRIVGEIDEPAASGPHLNEQRREDYAIRIHCANKDAKDADVARLFETIDAHDPIVHEDCPRNAVIRESDIDGRIATLNFIGWLGGRAPMTPQEENSLRKDVAAHFASYPGGPLNYRSETVKFRHWWARMPYEVRRRNAADIRQGVTSLQTLYDMRANLTSKATLNLGLMSLCDLSVTKLKHETRMAQLRARSIFVQDSWGGWTWVNPGDVLYAGTDTFNALSPLVKHQCERAWQ